MAQFDVPKSMPRTSFRISLIVEPLGLRFPLAPGPMVKDHQDVAGNGADSSFSLPSRDAGPRPAIPAPLRIDAGCDSANCRSPRAIAESALRFRRRWVRC